MRYIYFKNSSGECKFVCTCDESKVMFEIELDIARRAPHFKHYYTRHWVDDNGVGWYDVGSWSEFYLESDIPLKNEFYGN